jgi:three-Cys-motif partner protein
LRGRRTLKFDRVGEWSELKLQIIKEYAAAYSQILTAQKSPRLAHLYIDAFAGAGTHISKRSGSEIPGSPTIALEVRPKFCEYHFIDLDRERAAELRRLAEGRKDFYVYEGDCNDLLLERVFPRARFKDYRRALCLLDPYGLHLNWEVIRAAGEMGSIDMFLNFPVGDMNRNVFWRNPDGVAPADIQRMNAFWGDESWRTVVYSSEGNLFGYLEKGADNEGVARAFRDRLKTAAGFKSVSEPLPMRNSKRVIIYYLFFASQKPVAGKIIRDIFDKHRKTGAS